MFGSVKVFRFVSRAPFVRILARSKKTDNIKKRGLTKEEEHVRKQQQEELARLRGRLAETLKTFNKQIEDYEELAKKLEEKQRRARARTQRTTPPKEGK